MMFAAIVMICAVSGPCVIVESAPAPSPIVCLEFVEKRSAAWREILASVPRVGAPDGGELVIRAGCERLIPDTPEGKGI